MKVVGADVFDYRLNYAHGEYVMSGGRAALFQVGTLVRLRTDEGLEGWGEITPLGSTYLPTSSDLVRAGLAEILPALIGLDPTNISAANRAMDAAVLGQGYAKSAIDIACWDLLGKSAGLPISALLGGVLQEDFPIYEAVPLGSPQSMADFITARRAAGINRFQLKVGNRPDDDVARTRACAEAGEGKTVIIADSNGGWNILDAQLAIRGMEDLPVYVEQPCRTTQDSIIAHRNSSVPLVLDESITNATELFEAKTVAGAMSVNIKISRVGGLTKAARMRDLMQDLNMMVSVEDMWGGDVITAAVSHIAASTRPESLLNISFFNDWTDGHVAGYAPRSSNGRGSAPSGPGLGIVVDTDKLGTPIFSIK
ncbi:mandelate racemase/muconate lactonizing enzyme family protein [Mycobacterium sp. 155]|uniref:mandelate racemase/muconate lactonizing enzyme family protein n=1 Tax=Mycobacterium sp. 155 TaxID=1157943 RepID=UPI00037AF58F|nr:mandelate racemase/muconate lactonizing enzyme family protein [Mycobacterium sp. 155]